MKRFLESLSSCRRWGLFFVLAFSSAGPVAAAPGLEVTAGQDATTYSISYEGKPILVYSFAPQKFKPYVKELHTLKGDNLLRDAPFDHLHHHALMYGIRVNGVNFWEETSGNGVQKVVQTAEPVRGSDSEQRPRAALSQTLHWVAPQDAFLPNNAPVALLIEHRTLTLTIHAKDNLVILEWEAQFEVGPRTNTVVLSGANYHGLGVRFLQDLDPLAIHSLAGRRPDLSNNRQDISPAPWAAVSFDAPERPATLVLAGHPSNGRGDATFFSMLTPFAYLSATQALDREPLVYHTGDKWELRYLVVLSAEAKPSDRVRQVIEEWRTTHAAASPDAGTGRRN